MRIVEALDLIRSSWMSKVSHRLARGEGVRDSFRVSLNVFYDLLQQAVETGDPAWLNPVLDEWIEARTQTDLDSGETTLLLLVEQNLHCLHEVAQELLPPADALELTGAILPVFSYAFTYASRQETELRMRTVYKDLEKVTSQLERLDKSKSDFISIAAHELKTPLTLIEGYAGMLRDLMIALGDEAQELQLLRGIDTGSKRLREIVDDMIDVSMIDNNLLALNFQPLWVGRLFKTLQKEFSGTLEKRNQTMEVLSFPGADEMLLGDPERLYQAFRNLVTNAMKYTPDGGRITVDGRKLPGFLEVTLTDTGIGIDPQDHQRIFQKFGRLGDVATHSSGKTKFKGGGPGLGLPITRGIVEAHGGAIWVESPGYDEKNCPGTVFHVLLPLQQTSPEEKLKRLFSLSGQPENDPLFPAHLPAGVQNPPAAASHGSGFSEVGKSFLEEK